MAASPSMTFGDEEEKDFFPVSPTSNTPNSSQKQKMKTRLNLVNVPPKKKNFSFSTDFLVVSEFSELEGPVVLSVYPEGASANFNLNHLVLRIMSVDNQKSADIIRK